MRTNVAGFALAVGMGLIVVLLGLLALSAAGLTELAPGLAEVEIPADSVATAPKLYGEYGIGPHYEDRPAGSDTTQLVAVGLVGGDAAAIQEGDALFKNNCAQCHAINEKVVGPALAGITKRRSIGWLVKWVQNSAKVIASGDEYAVKLFNDNGKQQMPAFPQLSDKDVQAIIAYVSVQERAVADGPGATLAVR